MAQQEHDPLIGAKLGDYTIQGLLGKGGMARVYRGVDDNLGRHAAIKVLQNLPNEPDEYQTIVERFKREARAIAKFDHPHIVTVYQFGEKDGQLFIAMKLVEGKTNTLSLLLRRSQLRGDLLPPERVLEIVDDVGSALDYAHKRGIIHRDVKPSNVLLDGEGRAILTDFGLALELDSGATMGTAFGTPRYIAPEQALASQDAVPQSDIYALGVIVFQMFTGRLPFEDESPMNIALQHITTPPPSPRSLNQSLPEAAEHVILKALSKAPDDRYPTAGEFAAALREAFITQPASPTLPTTTPEARAALAQAARRGEPESAVLPPDDSLAGLDLEGPTMPTPLMPGEPQLAEALNRAAAHAGKTGAPVAEHEPDTDTGTPQAADSAQAEPAQAASPEAAVELPTPADVEAAASAPLAARPAAQAAKSAPSSKPVPSARRKRRRRPLLVLVSVVLIALATLAGWLAAQGQLDDLLARVGVGIGQMQNGGGDSGGGAVTTGGGLLGAGLPVRLVYDAQSLALRNLNDTPVSVEGIRLVADDLAYPGWRFYGPLPAGQCARIYLRDAASRRVTGCPTVLHNVELLRDAAARFWVNQDSADTFFSVMAGDTLLAQCAFAATSCEFNLPTE